MPASIFISHSAKDPEGREYFDALVEGLGQQHEVWVDKQRLEGSDDWERLIANEMAECHGAVALFSTKALESRYFEFEVSNLFARWLREGHGRSGSGADRFRFCPVVVPPVTVDQVKASPLFSAIGLRRDNWIVPASAADALAQVQRMFEGLSGWPSPLEALEADVRFILDQVTEPKILLNAATHAGFGSGDVTSVARPAAHLARLYMRCAIRPLCASLLRLRPALGAEKTQNLFELLAPSWVSFEAGRRFAAYLCVTENTPAQRFAVITGEFPHFTPLMYLMRARGTLREASHVVVVPPPRSGSLSAAEFQTAVETGLADYLARYFKGTSDPGIADDLDRLHRALAVRDRGVYGPLLGSLVDDLVVGGGAVLVVVPAEPADFDLIEDVSAALRQVTFVALRGRTASVADDSPRLILPVGSQEHEYVAYKAFRGFTGAR